MSLNALVWAFRQDIKPAATKFVLVAFADNCNDTDGTGWPSVRAICAKTSLNRKTVIGALDRLEAMGILRDTGKRMGSTSQVKVYQLTGLDVIAKDALQQHIKRVPESASLVAESVPLLPPKSPVFTTKESQKRDTEPSIEPSITNKEEVAPPEWIPAATWAAFREMRKKIRAPLTPTAERLLIQKLGYMQAEGQSPVAVIEQSIERGWRGFFPVINKGTKNDDSKGRGISRDFLRRHGVA